VLSARGSRPPWAWFDRLTPAAVCVSAVAAASGLAAATEAGSRVAVVAALAGVVAPLSLLLLVVVRRRQLAERAWDGGQVLVADRSTASSDTPGAEAGPPSRWRVVAALGRVEARELACSPWLAIGLGLQLFVLLASAVIYVDEDNSLWAEVTQQLVAFCHPLVGMVVVGAHAATTRDRHDGAEELFGSCPADPSTRTLALLSTSAVPVVALATFIALYVGSVAVLGDQVYGPADPDVVPGLLSALVIGAGGALLGVAVGRWVGWRLAPVVAVVAVGALSLRLGADGQGWNSWAQLSTFPSVRPEVFQHRPTWWYLAWLLGLTTFVAAVALARSARGEDLEGGPPLGRPLAVGALGVGVLGVGVAAVAAVMVTRPMPPATAERIADLVARPAAHQTCTDAGAAVRVCSYVGYGELRDRVAAEVAPVAASLPLGGSVTLRQRFEGGVADLLPEVARRLPQGIPSAGPGEIDLPFDPLADGVVATRFLVALASLDLPVGPAAVQPGGRGSGPRPLVVAGQARGVVALWLATRGLDPDAAIKRATAGRRGQRGATPATADAFDRGFAWPTSCETAPVVWSAQDLAAARAILGRPAAEVTSAVHRGWDRWRDPGTGTDALLAEVGLPPAGPFDQVVSRDPGSC